MVACADSYWCELGSTISEPEWLAELFVNVGGAFVGAMLALALALMQLRRQAGQDRTLAGEQRTEDSVRRVAADLSGWALAIGAKSAGLPVVEGRLKAPSTVDLVGAVTGHRSQVLAAGLGETLEDIDVLLSRFLTSWRTAVARVDRDPALSDATVNSAFAAAASFTFTSELAHAAARLAEEMSAWTYGGAAPRIDRAGVQPVDLSRFAEAYSHHVAAALVGGTAPPQRGVPAPPHGGLTAPAEGAGAPRLGGDADASPPTTDVSAGVRVPAPSGPADQPAPVDQTGDSGTGKP